MSEGVQPEATTSWMPLDNLYSSLLGIVGAFLICLYLYRLGQGVEIDWPATFESLGAFATTVGVAIGGWWALLTLRRQRVRESRLDIQQDCQVWSPAEGRLVLRFGVTIQNIGLIELTPTLASSRVQIPPSAGLDPDRQPVDYWTTVREVVHQTRSDEVVLEPGESETYWHDVELPSGAKWAQVHSDITCQGRDIKYWDETRLISVADVRAAGSGSAPKV